MLQLIDIAKSYVTAGFTQVALDHVSLSFRDSEFVAILGPSGSGKTTLLNVLGGLDHADSGDIVVSGVSTKDYSDKDWDTYRNHRIGFIFQSYNLIPHQTVLANVELALTLAGIGRTERRERAAAALERVGLAEHVNKRPSQLSGGQMQRVAIARALVNDPEIVLADEPTGALDTETGIQVMNLLAEIANERLIIMVTHNPELAEEYATRIVRLADGRITSDTDPFDADAAGLVPLPEGIGEPDEGPDPADGGRDAEAESRIPGGADAPAGAPDDEGPATAGPVPRPEEDVRPGDRGPGATSPVDKGSGHASMSFLTALALSFNNLMTKKGRTFMTAFAGSIGIIGIAAILALSNGVNSYIADTEEEALSSYPLTITKSSFDLSNLMMVGMASSGPGSGSSGGGDVPPGSDLDAPIYQNSIMGDMFSQVKTNNLKDFRTYLESGESGIEPYVNSIQYGYGVTPHVYQEDTSTDIVQLNPSYMGSTLTNGIMGSALTGGTTMASFNQLTDDERMLHQQMELVAGEWPESYDECVLVLNRNGGITDYTLYSIGVYDTKAMEEMTNKALSGDEVTVPEATGDFTFADALALRFRVVPPSDLYQKNAEQGTWTDMSSDKAFMRKAIAEGIELKVVGIIKRSEDSSTSSVTEGIGYLPSLTMELMDIAAAAEIVQEQKADPDVDVFTGKTFEELADAQAQDFDMSSMFQIDEEKISQAFSFDTDALSDLGGGMDLSGMDLSGMDLSGMDLTSLMSGFDLSSLSFDTTALSSTLGGDTFAQIMANAPQFDTGSLSQLLSFDGLTEEQLAELSNLTDSLTSGFMAWYLAPVEGGGKGGTFQDLMTGGMAQSFSEYLQLPEVQASLQTLTGPLGDQFAADAYANLSAALGDYLTNELVPYLTNSITVLMTQAAETMVVQLSQQIQDQMSGAAARLGEEFGSQLSTAIGSQLSSQMSGLSEKMQDAFSFDADTFADAIKFNMTQDDLASLLSNYMNAEKLTYDNNLKKLGYAELGSPESISIYPVDFPSKDEVLAVIDGYNDRMEAEGKEEQVIQYSDFAGTLMSSVTDIVNTISLVLIAFVSISLVVSSIMISIITYISVLERKKEIGILRAMGASKLNIANVFNAETVIEGFLAGIFAILVVYGASVPVNALVLELEGVPNIMQLPAESAVGLVGISVALTLVAGLIPSSAAARRDPVEALRSE